MPRTLRRMTGSAVAVVAVDRGGGREMSPATFFCYFSSTLRGLSGKNWPWRRKSGVRYHVSDIVVDVTELAFLALEA